MIALSYALVTCVLLAQEVTIPQNDGWVTDQAGLLSSDQEDALEKLCESYRTGTTHEIALLTVTDLGGQPIEDFAFDVGRAWKLGTTEEDNGALLVVSKDDKKIRIEVSRGLEGSLTDSISGRIIRNEIGPRFEAGDYYGGLRAGLEAIHAAIGGEYAPIDEPGASGGGEGRASGLVMLVLLFIVIAISRGRGRGSGGGMPWWVVPTLLGSRGLGGGGGWSGSSSGGGGGFRGFGGGGGFRGGGATGGWR